MRVRFVDVGNRFKFEPGTLGAGKDFKLKIWKGGVWTAAEARVKLESSGVEIRPVKGELIVNDQPVQVSAILAPLDTVCLRADDRRSAMWQYQEDFAAAKRTRREKEKAEGLVRPSPRSEEGDKIAKALASRIKINEQGIEIKSFFRWKQLPWDQLESITYSRNNSGGAVAAGAVGGLIGAAIGAAIDAAYRSASKPKGESDFVLLFEPGNYQLSFNASEASLFATIPELPAASCVVLCELLEEYAPFDVVRSV